MLPSGATGSGESVAVTPTSAPTTANAESRSNARQSTSKARRTIIGMEAPLLVGRANEGETPSIDCAALAGRALSVVGWVRLRRVVSTENRQRAKRNQPTTD